MNWRRWAAVVAVVLMVISAYLSGKHSAQVDDSLKLNADSVHVTDSVTRSDSAKTDTARKKAAILTTYQSHVREKVLTRHDTVFVDRGGGIDRDTIINPEIAQLIQADDSTIQALKNLVASQDTLIAALRKGVEIRDSRIRILESERNPGKLKGILAATKYIAIGAVLGAALSHR